MTYEEYFQKFCENDREDVVQFVSNKEATSFLLENAPRLYCPDREIEETFAFRTWTMRKHIQKTEVGFLLTEFLTNEQLPWAGKYNTINAGLTHHLNEFRWLKNADWFLDYIDFFINGDGSVEYSKSAFSYHTPALTAIYQFCLLTGNEAYLKNNVEALEKYFEYWEDRHLTLNGLYWSIDDREGTEFTISGTTPEIKSLRGFRPLLNSCMYGDAVSLAKIFALVHNTEKQKHYEEKARGIREKINKKMWDGEFFKAIHPLDQDLDKEIDYTNIPNELNARELMGYIPWAFCVPTQGREKAFAFLKDSKVFQGKTGFATADISHPRFLYSPEHSVCMWNGHVWPYATSYVVNAVIALLNEYRQSVLTNEDLYAFIKTYAEMHRSYEDGKWIRFIDEEMFPFEYKWRVREMAKQGRKIMGGQNRGKDYNHSTFIDLVLKGLCGIASRGNELVVEPKIQGIWKWFKIENLTVRKQTYTVYYDEDGNVFNKGKGVIVEKQLD